MGSSSHASQRRYTPEQRAQAVRLVRQSRAETGQEYGAVQRVAAQLGFGVESVRSWVKQADIDDGGRPGDDEHRQRADPRAGAGSEGAAPSERDFA